jgi:hypothetical protein
MQSLVPLVDMHAQHLHDTRGMYGCEQVLHVADNELASLPESIGDMTSLTDLRLHKNQLTVRIHILAAMLHVLAAIRHVSPSFLTLQPLAPRTKPLLHAGSYVRRYSVQTT